MTYYTIHVSDGRAVGWTMYSEERGADRYAAEIFRRTYPVRTTLRVHLRVC